MSQSGQKPSTRVVFLVIPCPVSILNTINPPLPFSTAQAVLEAHTIAGVGSDRRLQENLAEIQVDPQSSEEAFSSRRRLRAILWAAKASKMMRRLARKTS